MSWVADTWLERKVGVWRVITPFEMALARVVAGIEATTALAHAERVARYAQASWRVDDLYSQALREFSAWRFRDFVLLRDPVDNRKLQIITRAYRSPITHEHS